nr:ciliogenesis-associated TTC17-interacting protein isoform X3 [Taeniopygia guttata]
MEPRPESPQDTPGTADTAAEFLSLIGLKELEWCLFAETLAVVAPPRDKAEGQWWMAAQWAPYQREGEPVQSCILVQTKFRGKQDGVPASSTLKAYVTWQLETLEQEEQECLELRPYPTEKTTHIVSHEHGMTVTKTLQEGGPSTARATSAPPAMRLAQLMQIGFPVLMLLQDESILSKSGLSLSSPSPNNLWTGRRTWSSTAISWTGRTSCNYPMLPTSSSTPRSGHCCLTSSRHCSSSSHMTPSPLLRNSSPTSGPLGAPLAPLELPAPSPTPQLATLHLTANKAAGSACPVLFALGKLRLREGRWS